MAPKRIMVISGQKIILDIVTRQLKSEFSNLALAQAWSTNQGLALLQKEPCDCIICWHSDLTQNSLKIFKNKRTPLVVLKRNANEKPPIELPDDTKILCLDGNWTHNLFALFRAKSNPQQLRSEHRYHIPNLKVVLQLGKEPLRGDVTNINSTGLLAEFDYRDDCSEVLNGVELTLSFPDHYEYAEIYSVPGKVLRLQSLGFNQSAPKRVRLVILFHQAYEDFRRQLKSNLTLAARESRLESFV